MSARTKSPGSPVLEWTPMRRNERTFLCAGGSGGVLDVQYCGSGWLVEAFGRHVGLFDGVEEAKVAAEDHLLAILDAGEKIRAARSASLVVDMPPPRSTKVAPSPSADDWMSAVTDVAHTLDPRARNDLLQARVLIQCVMNDCLTDMERMEMFIRAAACVGFACSGDVRLADLLNDLAKLLHTVATTASNCGCRS